MRGRTNSALSNAKRRALAELRDATESELSSLQSKARGRMRGMWSISGLATLLHAGCYVEIEATSDSKASIAKRGEIDSLLVQGACERRCYRPELNGALHACGGDVRGSNAPGAAPAFVVVQAANKRTIGHFVFPR